MSFDDFIAACDWNFVNAARLLDTTVANICGYAARDRIPLGRQYEIQAKLGGELVADNFDAERDYRAEALKKGSMPPKNAKAAAAGQQHPLRSSGVSPTPKPSTGRRPCET